jgi:hypothetical protein
MGFSSVGNPPSAVTTVFADNVNFAGGKSPTISADGQLLIGSTSAPNIRVGTITSGDSSITVTAGAGTLALSVTGGTTVGKTITGTTGGALSPTGGNWNILGNATQGVSFSGSGSTLTGTVADATTTQKGVAELATDAETIAGTANTVNVTPESLKAKLGTQTNHGVLVGAGQTAAITALAVGANNSILMGNTGADPAFTTSGTPYVTGISFDSGTNTLSSYINSSSWTPVLQFGGATTGITYSTQTGRYTRIGNLVYFTCNVVLTSKGSATGTAKITGLPVAAGQLAIVQIRFGIVTFSGWVAARIDAGDSQIGIDQTASLGSPTQWNDTNFSNTSFFAVSGCYQVS